MESKLSNDKIIENLNTALQMEMTAAHQYQLHAHVLEEWGLSKLTQTMRGEMAEELEHSDRFIARIMFLKGAPEIAFQKPVQRSQSLMDMFRSDLAAEEEAIGFYVRASKGAYDAGDLGTRALFEEIAIEEESHKAWLEGQLDLIERLGEKLYSAKFVAVGDGDDEDGSA